MGMDLIGTCGKGVRLDSIAEGYLRELTEDFFELLEKTVPWNDPTLDVVFCGVYDDTYPLLILFRRSTASSWGCETPELNVGFQETPEESQALVQVLDKMTKLDPELTRKLTFGWFIGAKYS